MAHHKSALKRIRQTHVRNMINNARRNRIRSFIRRVDAGIASGVYQDARDAFRAAESEIMRGVTKGILKRNTAARKISRLNARVKALAS